MCAQEISFFPHTLFTLKPVSANTCCLTCFLTPRGVPFN